MVRVAIRCIGGIGDDRYVFLPSATAQTDTITELTGEGTDTLDFGGLTDAVTMNLSTATTALGGYTNRTVNVAAVGQAAFLENVTTGSGNDTVTGNAAANVLTGGAGNDILTGGEGSDSLIGGLGNDKYVFVAATAAQNRHDHRADRWRDRYAWISADQRPPSTFNLSSGTTTLGSQTNRVLLVGAAGQAAFLENLDGRQRK